MSAEAKRGAELVSKQMKEFPDRKEDPKQRVKRALAYESWLSSRAVETPVRPKVP